MIKVVLVEDEDLVRREIALTTPWSEMGCTLIGEASNGLEGLELIEKTRPHLVITDIRMPGLDGLAMLEELEKKMGTGQPYTILLTGHSDFEYARKGIRLGVKDYLLKPIDDSEFHRILSKASRELEEIRDSREKGQQLIDSEENTIARFREYVGTEGNDSKEEYVRLSVQYIKDRYRDDISMIHVADKLGISQGYLSRVFKERTGYTFLEYLTCFRMRKAVLLLQDRTLRINEVAYMSGFQDNGYFTQLFKKYLGMTPGQYRKSGTGLFRNGFDYSG